MFLDFRSFYGRFVENRLLYFSIPMGLLGVHFIHVDPIISFCHLIWYDMNMFHYMAMVNKCF